MRATVHLPLIINELHRGHIEGLLRHSCLMLTRDYLRCPKIFIIIFEALFGFFYAFCIRVHTFAPHF